MTVEWRRYTAGVVVALVLLLSTYVTGIVAGQVLNVRGASDFCPARSVLFQGNPLAPSDEIRFIPLSHECVWRDGKHMELVPGWVNPALALLSLTAVALLALRYRSGRTRQTPDV